MSAERIRRNGVEAIRGDLARPDTYLRHAAGADAVIHTAFEYLPDGAENIVLEMRCTEALLRVIGAGRARHFIYTSNAYLPGIGAQAGTEAARQAGPSDPRPGRLDVERMVLSPPRPSAKTAVLRLGMVYGGRSGTIASLFDAAQRSGRLAYSHDCAANRWSLIYLHDLAAFYGAVVDAQLAGVYHVVDGQPMSVQRVLECVSAASDAPLSIQTAGKVREILDPHTVDIMNADVAWDTQTGRPAGWSPRLRNFEAGVAQAYAEWAEQMATQRLSGEQQGR